MSKYLDNFTLGLIIVIFTILIGTAANAWNQTIQYGIQYRVIKRRKRKGLTVKNEVPPEVLLDYEETSFKFVYIFTSIILFMIVIIAYFARISSSAKRLIS